jgi:Zn-dependent protease
MFAVSHGTMMFGGAKPVPVNPNNYRNFKRGDIIVSLAGVFVNFLLALASVLVFVLVGLIARGAPALDSTLGVVQAMMFISIRLNLLLIAFNLIPIPPLDGSHVLKYLLPLNWAVYYQQVGRYGIVVLIVLLSFGNGFLNFWMRPAMAFGGMLMQVAGPFALPTLNQWLR